MFFYLNTIGTKNLLTVLDYYHRHIGVYIQFDVAVGQSGANSNLLKNFLC